MARTIVVAMIVLLGSVQVSAQRHELFSSRSPAGEIGRIQVSRRPELAGVFQPVLLKVPAGANVSVAESGGFGVAQVDAQLVSLQVGSTYRMRVSGIPHKQGDVYPTLELIDRMHAPAGKETRYPIPIDITADELGMALAGKYVTRVVYVEDPRRALPIRDLPEQRYFEVMANEDPLHVAGSLGRPVAILRMGSLAPTAAGPSTEFLFGSPPLQHHAMLPTRVPYEPSSPIPNNTPPEPAADGAPTVDSSPAADETPAGIDEVSDDEELNLPKSEAVPAADGFEEDSREQADVGDEDIFGGPDFDAPKSQDDNPFGDDSE